MAAAGTTRLSPAAERADGREDAGQAFGAAGAAALPAADDLAAVGTPLREEDGQQPADGAQPPHGFTRG